MKLRTAEITEQMMEQFKINHIEDTPANRVEFLTGVKDAWSEDTSVSIEKSLYQLTIMVMIQTEKFKVRTGK